MFVNVSHKIGPSKIGAMHMKVFECLFSKTDLRVGVGGELGRES